MSRNRGIVTTEKTYTISERERCIWIALSSDLRFGARHFQYLLALNAPLAELWELSAQELRSRGLDADCLELFAQVRGSVQPEKVAQKLQRARIRCLTVLDPEYPQLLREISVPPAVLYVRGHIDEAPRLAVVGTRQMSQYGRRVTQDLVEPLARTGLTIVSGLALGVDGEAHRSALRAGGTTWAILPGGVDCPYPAAHGQLAQEILEHGGALISEFPPGTDALKHHFPIRNRIIAGLARATLVIEATEKSGTLLTARSALEANRDVFTIPGSIYSPGSAGPHRLIQLGAKLVHSVDDILLELGLQNAEAEAQSRAILPDSAQERAILEILTGEPLLLDALIQQVDLDTPTVMSTLTLMEMKGKVKNLGGNQYVRR